MVSVGWEVGTSAREQPNRIFEVEAGRWVHSDVLDLSVLSSVLRLMGAMNTLREEGEG